MSHAFFSHKFDVASLEKMKNGELNNVIGNGEPKYSASAMKSKTKASLQDEALTAYHDWLTDNPVKKARAAGAATGAKGAVQKVSKNKDCAASKKCNLIKAIIAGKKTAEQATEAWAFDGVLQAYWPQEQFVADIAAAQKGERPKAGKQMVQLTIDL